jgi:hypothetical protein
MVVHTQVVARRSSSNQSNGHSRRFLPPFPAPAPPYVHPNTKQNVAGNILTGTRDHGGVQKGKDKSENVMDTCLFFFMGKDV